MIIVPVILKPARDRRDEVDRLLQAFRDSLVDSPPVGMQGLVVLRTETGELIVEGRWQDAAAHRAYRSNARGAELFQKLAACCEAPPVTYYGTVDSSLSFERQRNSDI